MFLITRFIPILIADIARKEGATVVILSNNNTGKALAPRLSVKLKAGIGSGVSKLPSASIRLLFIKGLIPEMHLHT